MSLNNNLDHEELTRTLTENFKVLADEVQHLNDRNLILEHKLRFAQESVSLSFFYLPVSYDEQLSSRSGAAFRSDDRQKTHVYF